MQRNSPRRNKEAPEIETAASLEGGKDDEVEFGDIVESDGDENRNSNSNRETPPVVFAHTTVRHLELFASSCEAGVGRKHQSLKVRRDRLSSMGQ
jgi:hypothetical protein